MALEVAINGTGRIGLCVSKILAERADLELVAINTTMPIETLIHLLKYDSVQKDSDVEQLGGSTIRIGKQSNIQIISTRMIEETHFGKYGAELVLCTCLDQQIGIACQVAEELGLPHPYSYEKALEVTNKEKMKKIMWENGMPTSRYFSVMSPHSDKSAS